MQKILLTGAAGFIGSHVAEALLDQGYAVLGIDNFDPFYDRSIKEQNLEAVLRHPAFQFVEGNLDDASLYEGLEAFDLVVHIAAKAGVGPSVRQPVEYASSNIMATLRLVECMRERGIRKMVFASSSSVYGNNRKLPFHEEDAVIGPISPYAFSKRSCELMMHTYHSLHQLDVLNLRFFTVYGPRQRPDLAIHKFARMIDRGEAITMYGDGTTARDYTYVEDTVQGVLAALRYVETHENVYEIINLGNGAPVRLMDMIQSIADAMGKEAKIERLPMQPGDVDMTFASIDKARKLLGYNPTTPFSVGVRRFVEWYQNKRVPLESA